MNRWVGPSFPDFPSFLIPDTDRADTRRDAARHARRVRRRLALSQVEFSARTHVNTAHCPLKTEN
jgi:hypothetical protein